MAGAIGKGFIHFGGTDVAVKLHSAVREERIRFHLLHRNDQAHLRQQMICAVEKLPIPAEDQIKDFELEEGKYVIVDPGELEQIVPESNRMIEVHEFVKAEQVSPRCMERVYALEPDRASPRGASYEALVKALTAMGVVGICTWTMRKRSYFGALQAVGDTLRLNTLRHADEVVPATSLGLQATGLSERELAIGTELIGKMTALFEPGKFVNEHEQKLRDLIANWHLAERCAPSIFAVPPGSRAMRPVSCAPGDVRGARRTPTRSRSRRSLKRPHGDTCACAAANTAKANLSAGPSAYLRRSGTRPACSSSTKARPGEESLRFGSRRSSILGRRPGR